MSATSVLAGVVLLAGIALAASASAHTAYVANAGVESVSVIDTATNKAAPTTIKVGNGPFAIAITPDGKTAYVANFNADSVSVIDTATNTASPTAIPVGESPISIAITPNQPSLAAFVTPTTRARPGVPLKLDASASKDPDGGIASFAWDFGDKQAASLTTPTALHTFAHPGAFEATLTLTDNEGCSTAQLFTGQTASCNGSALATMTKTVKVAYPGVKVRCPRRARPKGCAFRLQVFAKKPKKGRKAKPESAIARAKVKAGHSKIVSLEAKPAFKLKLAAARKVLVKETVSAAGSTHTRYLRLAVVQ